MATQKRKSDSRAEQTDRPSWSWSSIAAFYSFKKTVCSTLVDRLLPSPKMDKMQVAWIGLGNMGMRMAKNVAEKGPQSCLVVYNRNRDRAATLLDSLQHPSAVTIAASLGDAVGPSRIIFICVADDASLMQVVAAARSSEGGLSGKIVVNMTTVHPDTSRLAQSLLDKNHAFFIECPVCGPPSQADTGNLVAVPAGPVHAIQCIRPFLQGVIARAVIDMGGRDVGTGSLMKIIGNAFVLTSLETVSECLVLAEKSGLGAGEFQRWMDVMYPGSLAHYSRRMTSGNYWTLEKPLFSLHLAEKDVGHANTLARELDVDARFLATIKEQFEETRLRRGDVDAASVYGTVREDSGLSFGA